MILSKNFTLAELTKTEREGFNNKPPDSLLGTAHVLCATLLQPIRDHFKSPLIIHSGYRSPALNNAIGGSPTSQHIRFEAADFHVKGLELTDVFQWVWKQSGLKWGQLILEGWEVGKPTWIHISLGDPYRPKAKSQQVLKFEAGKYTHLVK